MIRQNNDRINSKRRPLDHRKQQFAVSAKPAGNEYPHRLSLYTIPPLGEISLEQFEIWAIDRLKILAELESCSFRNKTPAETTAHMTPLLQKLLPLRSNTSSSQGPHEDTLRLERQKDHYSHYILRLAFSSTEDLRRRFARVETTLFKLRFQSDDQRERQAFVESLQMDWESVSEEERRALVGELMAATPGLRRGDVLDEGGWFKVDFETVPELVETRRVLLRGGKAYVPMKEQLSMVLAAFNRGLEKGLELAARALPRLDEDDRLTPILNHLSKNFATPESSLIDTLDGATGLPNGAAITASSIDTLSPYFPLCMRNLHLQLRKNSHLKHYGRLQYTLFLKGLGLSLEDCLVFWRHSFKLITDETFNKEYRYNVRHTYGDVGGDAIRRGRGYAPFSCQKILTERPPGPGEAHGCPYRHFSVENLTGLLQGTGVTDRDLLRGVREDVERKRYHIACNRVFDHVHKGELDRARKDGTVGELGEGGLDTIVHPNTYFRRSYLLKCGGCGGGGGDGNQKGGGGGGEAMDTS